MPGGELFRHRAHRIVAVEVEPVVFLAAEVEQPPQTADLIGAERGIFRQREERRIGVGAQLVSQHEWQHLPHVLQPDLPAAAEEGHRLGVADQRHQVARRQAVHRLRADVRQPVGPASAPVTRAQSTRESRAVSLLKCSTCAPAVSGNSNWLAENATRRRTSGGIAAPRTV